MKMERERNAPAHASLPALLRRLDFIFRCALDEIANARMDFDNYLGDAAATTVV